MTTAPKSSPGAWRAVLFLFVAATLIPEVLIGSTPLSRFNTLLFELPLYGSAALVIREAVVRFQLSRAGLIVLGLAFGVTIEGLALQSVFNPHFLNLDISFGRAAGVNWPWAFYMVGYHALWSVTIPITLAELVFPGRASDAWLGRIGISAFIALLAVMVFAFHGLFVKMSGFQAPALLYAGAALAIIVFSFLGVQLKRRMVAVRPVAAYVPAIAIFLFGVGWLWLYGDIFHSAHFVAPMCNIAIGLVLAAAAAALFRRFALGTYSPRHAFSFVAGGLAANTAFGFVVVSASPAKMDLYGHIGVAVVVAAGLYALGRKVVASPGLPEEAAALPP